MKHLICALAMTGLVTACDSGSTPTKDSPTSKPAGASSGQTQKATTPKPAPAPPPAVKAKGPFPQSSDPAMKDPSKAKDKAPATFQAKFDTTAGAFTVTCTRDWAPHGVDRFYNLVKIGFFDDVSFFRAVPNFVVQFGIHGDPEVSKVWRVANLEPDKVKEGNKRGNLVYAMAGRPDTRSTQLFINFKDNDRLDGMGFASICKVDGEGMKVVDEIFTGYGEKAGRDQGNIQSKGNKHLREKWPKLDYIKTARLVEANTKK